VQVLSVIYCTFHGEYNFLVVWEVKDEQVIDAARKQFNIDIRLIENILNDFRDAISNDKIKGSRDDVVRTIELLSRCEKKSKSS
jgi:hypothetical protein